MGKVSAADRNLIQVILLVRKRKKTSKILFCTAGFLL